MITDPPDATAGVFAALFGGSIGMLIRERRRGKKDAYELALHLLTGQNERIDNLTSRVGFLEGKVDELRSENESLRAENAELIGRLKPLD